MGGAWLLDGLWERLVFAMVANRALAPSSKLGMEHWVASEALIDGLPEVEVHEISYVRQTRTGKLSLNKAKFRAEELFDGKFLVSSSDDGLSAEDIALGYKQLAAVERVFRDLKHTVDIRPVYHRLSDRIRAHVLLCWLALLLIRVAENETGQTWRQITQALWVTPGGHPGHATALLRAPDTAPQPLVDKTPVAPAYPPNAFTARLWVSSLSLPTVQDQLETVDGSQC